MCIFSAAVESVSNTRIFARMNGDGNQVLAYSMALKTAQPVAMLLPLPVAQSHGAAGLKFVSLEDYPRFFLDLELGFPKRPNYFTLPTFSRCLGPAAFLQVHSVGSFEASFVPTLTDFARLDPRFALPRETWAQLPLYREYGFAVFQLKAGESKVHPMAFSFAPAKPDRLFFPTVHIHDGQVHDRAEFDHTLYCQAPTGRGLWWRWRKSRGVASKFVKVEHTENMVQPDQRVYRRQMKGMFENQDVMVPLKRH